LKTQTTVINLTTEFSDATIHKQVLAVFIKELGVLSKCGFIPVNMTVSDTDNLDQITIKWEEAKNE